MKIAKYLKDRCQNPFNLVYVRRLANDGEFCTEKKNVHLLDVEIKCSIEKQDFKYMWEITTILDLVLTFIGLLFFGSTVFS